MKTNPVLPSFHLPHHPGPRPHLRMIILATEVTEVFCHIWVSPLPDPVVVEAVIDEVASGFMIHGTWYHQYSLTCKTSPMIPLPGSLSVNFYESCRQHFNVIEVANYIRSPLVVGVCATLDGVSALELMEWLEYHRSIGVQHFSLYNIDQNVPAVMKSYVDDYVENGILKFVRLEAPVEVEGREVVRVMKDVAMSDCLLSNRHLYNFSLMLDTSSFLYLKTPFTSVQQLTNLVGDFSYKLFRPGSYSLKVSVFPVLFHSHSAPSQQGSRLFTRFKKLSGSRNYTTAMVSLQDCPLLHTTHCFRLSPYSPLFFDIPPMYASINRYVRGGDDACEACVEDRAMVQYEKEIWNKIQLITERIRGRREELKR